MRPPRPRSTGLGDNVSDNASDTLSVSVDVSDTDFVIVRHFNSFATSARVSVLGLGSTLSVNVSDKSRRKAFGQCVRYGTFYGLGREHVGHIVRHVRALCFCKNDSDTLTESFFLSCRWRNRGGHRRTKKKVDSLPLKRGIHPTSPPASTRKGKKMRPPHSGKHGGRVARDESQFRRAGALRQQAGAKIQTRGGHAAKQTSPRVVRVARTRQGLYAGAISAGINSGRLSSLASATIREFRLSTCLLSCTT